MFTVSVETCNECPFIVRVSGALGTDEPWVFECNHPSGNRHDMVLAFDVCLNVADWCQLRHKPVHVEFTGNRL